MNLTKIVLSYSEPLQKYFGDPVLFSNLYGTYEGRPPNNGQPIFWIPLANDLDMECLCIYIYAT